MSRWRVFIAVILMACGGMACRETVTGGSSSDAAAQIHEVSAGRFTYRFVEAGCETGRHSFATLADYCEGLRSHRLNRGCALDQRKKEFEMACGKGFGESDRPHPIRLQPTPTPTPTPAPTPTPSPVPQVIADLRAAGITVDVAPSLSVDPDGPINSVSLRDFEKRFQSFLPTLTKAKGALIGRKSTIKKITLTDHAGYESERQALTLLVDLTPSELSEYLLLLDRRTAIERKLGLVFDFGKEVKYDDVADPLEVLRAAIVFFETNAETLKGLKGAVRRVVFSDHVRYALRGRVLYVQGETYQADLLSYAAFLAPLGPTLDGLAKAGIRLRLQDFTADRQRDLFSSQVLSIASSIDDLSDLMKRGHIAEVQMATQSPIAIVAPWLVAGGSERAILLTTAHPEWNAKIIHALDLQDQLQDEFKVPIATPTFFDDRYALSVQALKDCEAHVLKKLDYIRSIDFCSTRTVFSQGIFSVSEWESPVSLCAFIDSIPNPTRPGIPNYPFPGARPYGN